MTTSSVKITYKNKEVFDLSGIKPRKNTFPSIQNMGWINTDFWNYMSDKYVDQDILILSAFRDQYNYKENCELNNMLIGDLIMLGCKVYIFRGGWNVPDEDLKMQRINEVIASLTVDEINEIVRSERAFGVIWLIEEGGVIDEFKNIISMEELIKNSRFLGWVEDKYKNVVLKDTEDGFIVFPPDGVSKEAFSSKMYDILEDYSLDKIIQCRAGLDDVLIPNSNLTIVDCKFSKENMETAYSEIRGKSNSVFICRGVRRPSNFISRLAFNICGLQ